MEKDNTMEDKNSLNLKWAYVYSDGDRIICFVNNKTMKAYMADGYEKTDIEIKEFKFDRWLTPFDL